MRVGVPKEIKVQEHRVGLTPMAVHEYAAAGHECWCRPAPVPASAPMTRPTSPPRAHRRTAAEVFARADMIVSQGAAGSRVEDAARRADPLHLPAPGADPEQARGLLASGCIGVAYETVTDAHGGLPLLTPMSEVAGRLAIEAAAFSLRKNVGGKGLLLGGVPGVQPARVVVVGGGVVGTHAARMAVGLVPR